MNRSDDCGHEIINFQTSFPLNFDWLYDLIFFTILKIIYGDNKQTNKEIKYN